MQYKGFTLDQFQVDAINSVEKNNSVVVCAATGTGKTLIADYTINKFLKDNRRVIYTSPIKALTNQKYKQFISEYGKENIGILTGDVVRNPDAQILVMTTEVYRNMLLSQDKNISDVAYVIFDEIHFINDIERGTIWEESIIFSPDTIRFVCLSATIPNAQEFGQWIQSTHDHKVDIITYAKRAVPLEHEMFTLEEGFIKKLEDDQLSKREKKLRKPQYNGHDVINIINSEHCVPCIYFIFSRSKTEKMAKDTKTRLLNSKEKAQVSAYLGSAVRSLPSDLRNLNTTRLLRRSLEKGVGFHHAGLLPALKDIVEHLFSLGLVKVLFATETFAVGINMPAKTVIIDSLVKFDGRGTRYLNSTEYFQMAGRAGRRGIDKEGRAIAVFRKNTADIQKINRMFDEKAVPLKSQFTLSYNTILNLIKNHEEEEIWTILKRSLYHFQIKKKKDMTKANFIRMKKKLAKMGFIEGDTLSKKGVFTTKIYIKELTVGEIFGTDEWKTFNEKEIYLIVSLLAYEPRRFDRYQKSSGFITRRVFNKIQSHKTRKVIDELRMRKLENFLISWYEGVNFVELMNKTNLLEGDIIRFFRQVIDLLMQIRRATDNFELVGTTEDIIQKIDRDVIKVEF